MPSSPKPLWSNIHPLYSSVSQEAGLDLKLSSWVLCLLVLGRQSRMHP